MILIANNPLDIDAINKAYPANSIEQDIVAILSSSATTYRYDSIEQLKFELDLRKQIIQASLQLARSRFEFAIFRKSRCNPDYWDRTNEGGFKVKSGVKPSDAIMDIYQNSQLYATECATAMVIVYYKALLGIYPKALFDSTFANIHLMNWHYLDRQIQEVGNIKKQADYLPGDRRYFANPDVDPVTPEWQGENVIDLNKGLYYGHGVGIHKAEQIIEALNGNRKEGATTSAYLLDSAGRPNFKNLANILFRNQSTFRP